MNLMKKIIWLLVAAWLLVFTRPVLAHGPYDHSAQLTVGETQLELVVIMGADATRDFLANSGLPENILQALRPSPPQAPYNLPLTMAARLFEASVDGKPIAPLKVTVATAGLETLFTLVYPRPDGGALDLRAIYFNGIEPMKRGTFIAQGENEQSLGAAFLSRANNAISITLPPKPVVAPPGETNVSRAIAATANPEAATSPTPTPAVGGQFETVRWLLILALAAGLLLGLWRWFRRRA